MKKTISISVVLGLLVLLFVVVSQSKGSQGNEKIRIGAVLSLSGIAVQDGESIQEGLELAKGELKERGVDVEIIYQDDRTEPKDTISAINALAVQGVQAIIGPTWSFLADAGVPILDQLKIVSVMPANTSEYVGARSDYAFFTATKVEKIIPELTKWLEKNKKKNVAIVRNTGGAWYEVVGDTVKAAVASSGGQIVFEETVVFGSEADTLPTIVAKLKNIKADVLFAEIDDDKGLFVMFKKLQEQGSTLDIMSVTTAINRVLDENSQNLELENNVYALVPKVSEKFQSLFENTYNKKSGAYADFAYDSLMLLVEAIQNTGGSANDLALYLRNETSYKGFAKTYEFDENSDTRGGEWVIVPVRH